MVELKSALLFGVTMQFKMKMGQNSPGLFYKRYIFPFSTSMYMLSYKKRIIVVGPQQYDCGVCLEAVCPFSQDGACVSKGFCYLYGVNECEACCSVVLIWSVV